MKPELLNLQLPYAFSSRRLAEESARELRRESFSLGELEREKLLKISEVLNHPQLETLINEGKITLGMIKPKAYEGRNLPQDDDEAADVLISEIGKENILFTFPVKLTPDQASDFYSDVKTKYSQIVIDSETTLWNSICNFTQSGPLTFIFIYREQGDAIEWWRKKMGKTNPDQADSLSIRGKFALQENLPNNLTHGSDSKESVKKELEILKNIVSSLDNQVSEISKHFPSSELLCSFEFIENKDHIASIKKIFDSGIRPNSCIYGYEVNFKDKNGNDQVKFLKEKNVLSAGSFLAEKAQQQIADIVKLEEIGIPTLKLYGIQNATIYQEFVPLNAAEFMFNEIRKTPLPNKQIENYLRQLFEIGYTLNINGIDPLNFLDDIIVDSQTKKFFYTGVGKDNRKPPDVLAKSYVKNLIDRFPRHEAYIKLLDLAKKYDAGKIIS